VPEGFDELITNRVYTRGCTVSVVKTETSKKNCQKKPADFIFIFFAMCCPCPFSHLDGISACFDNILPLKFAI
jgi:hypothetical protein